MCPVDKVSVEKVSIEKMSVEKMSVEKMSVEKTSRCRCLLRDLMGKFDMFKAAITHGTAVCD